MECLHLLGYCIPKLPYTHICISIFRIVFSSRYSTMATVPASPTEMDMSSIRDFFKQYNIVTEQCYMSCIRDFTTRTISDREDKCVGNCLDKYLKMTQRLSTRFQEYQLLQAETMGPTAATTPFKKWMPANESFILNWLYNCGNTIVSKRNK